MAKIFCEKCKKKCRGEVLRVADKYFHKGCFTCSKCNKSLQTGGFFINEDSFYCQDDYQRYFVEKCRVCARELVGEIVTVSNHSFHRECFKCTSCYVNFHPGDRVTIWHERFFCPRCIGQECVIVPSCSQLTPKLNGISLSPTSITDDEGCISAVDASLSEFASPPQAGSGPTTNGRSKSVQLRSIEEFPWNSSQSKCITSNEQPQKSKSILRKSGQDHTVDRLALRENSHLSADSGVGDRLCESKTSEDPIHVPLYSEQMNGGNVFSPSNVLSPTGLSSSHHSRQSLSTRVPNSDYGRLLNQSYIHLDPTSPTSPDGYKRNVSFNTVTSCAKPKHFHIPEAKSRFLPVGVRTHSILFSRSTSSNTMPQTSTPRPKLNLTRQVEHPPQMTRSSIELSRKSYSDKSSDHDRARVNGSHANPSRSDEQEITGEARRLACFPAGQERNKTLPAPIERYDWPAPPASAVILAELMRERRCRRREQARLNGTLADDGVDYESQEALSIDCSYDGVTTAQGNTSVHQTSGIGQAILREEAEQKRRCRSLIRGRVPERIPSITGRFLPPPGMET
ncbi:unnamed protein product [Dicrocoelium dendriticum]|nr:unnamed protein product [Dicrocoelium dendriticum]